MRILISETTWAAMGLSRCLRETGFLLTRAEDEESLMDYVTLGRQDAVLVPLDLKRSESMAELRRLRDALGSVPLVVLAEKTTTPDLRVDALTAGADEIFEPGSSANLVAARLRQLVLRVHRIGAPQQVYGSTVVDLAERAVRVAGKPVSLSPLEYEIFETLVLQAGAPVSQNRLMDQLYAWDEEPDAKIIRVYLSKIRRKFMQAGASADLIETRWGQGYHLAADEMRQAA